MECRKGQFLLRIWILLFALFLSGGAKALPLRPTLIVYVPDEPLPFFIREFLTTSGETVNSCAEVNDLAKVLNVCEQLSSGRPLLLKPITGFEGGRDWSDASLGLHQPHPLVDVVTSQRSLRLEFIPMYSYCNPVVCGDNPTQVKIQPAESGDTQMLRCSVISPAPGTRVVSTFWHLSESEKDPLPLILEQNSVSLGLIRRFAKVSCAVTVFRDGFFGQIYSEVIPPDLPLPETLPTHSPSPRQEPEKAFSLSAEIPTPVWRFLAEDQETISVDLATLFSSYPSDALLFCRGKDEEYPCAQLRLGNKTQLTVNVSKVARKRFFDLVEVTLTGEVSGAQQRAVHPIVLVRGSQIGNTKPKVAEAEAEAETHWLTLAQADKSHWTCKTATENNSILDIFWLLDGTVLPESRGRLVLTLDPPRDQPHLVSCYAILQTTDGLTPRLQHALVKPEDPVLAGLPEPLLVFAADAISRPFTFRTSVQEPLRINCRIISEDGEIILANTCGKPRRSPKDNTQKVTWRLTTADLATLERHSIQDSPDRFFPQQYHLVISFTGIRNHFTMRREIRFARPNRRPEILGVWSWMSSPNETECLAAVYEPDGEHITGELRWFEDDEQISVFSTIPIRSQKNFSPAAAILGNQVPASVLLASSSIITIHSHAPCELIVSDGTLFSLRTAKQVSSLTAAQRALQGTIRNHHQTYATPQLPSALVSLTDSEAQKASAMPQKSVLLSLPATLTSSLSLLPYLPQKESAFTCYGTEELCSFLRILVSGDRFQDTLKPPCGLVLLTHISATGLIQFLTLEVYDEVEHHDEL